MNLSDTPLPLGPCPGAGCRDHPHVHRHDARYRGWRRCTVTCTCGWVQVDHRSRGKARRAFDRHLAAAALPPVNRP